MKKAQTPIQTIASLILVMIVIFVILKIGKNIAESQKKTYDRTLCLNSIAFASSRKTPDFSRYACQAPREVIAKKDFEDDYLDDGVKREIGDLMLDCWSLSNAGKLMPYTASPNEWGLCDYIDFNLICSIVSFEDIEPFKGLYSWLIDHPRSGARSAESYFRHLYGAPTNEIVELHNQEQDEYDTSKEYAVVWKVAYKVAYKIARVQPEEIERIIPVVVDKEWSGVVFVPYSEIIPPTITQGWVLAPGNCMFVMN